MPEKTIDADSEVFHRAKERGQPTFTLVGQDVTAAKTVAFWIMENIATAPGWKLREALDRAIRMRDFRPHKSAD